MFNNKKESLTNEELAQKIVWENIKNKKISIIFKFLTLIYLFALLYFLFDVSKNFNFMNSSSNIQKEHIAIVSLEGMIASNMPANSSNIIRSLENAFKANNSTMVALKINSPGGSPVHSDEIYNAINYLKNQYNKPIVSIITDTGASGAYYIAAATDYIYANPMSIVGSIGVTSGGFGFVNAIEKLGIERRIYTAGDSKNTLDPFLPENEKEIEKWNTVLNDVHENFINAVINGRGDKLKTDNESLFTGQIWSGNQAIELGLIDNFKSLYSLKIETELEAYDYTYKPKNLSNLFSNISLNVINELMNQNIYSLR